MVDCCVCLTPSLQGFPCPSMCGTFTCWDCLHLSYEAAAKPGAVHGCSNKDGDLLCSNVKCRCPITVDHLINSNPTPSVLKGQQNLKIQASVAIELQMALVMQKRQLEAEHAMLAQIADADERAAAKLRRTIIHDVLTLRCPRCRSAFLDFNGCFALRCSHATCGCAFCAWCLKDCGQDAHNHVRRCPDGNGTHFGSFDDFLGNHRTKRITAIRLLIKKAALRPAARNKLKDHIGKDLEDLQISIDDVFPKRATAATAPTEEPQRNPDDVIELQGGGMVRTVAALRRTVSALRRPPTVHRRAPLFPLVGRMKLVQQLDELRIGGPLEVSPLERSQSVPQPGTRLAPLAKRTQKLFLGRPANDLRVQHDNA